MKKLTKEMLAEKADLVQRIRDAKSCVETAIHFFNSALETAREELEAELREYNYVLREAEGWCHDRATEMFDYQAERSERWQESDAGQVYEAWREAYDCAFDAVDLDLPENIDEPDMDHADDLESLPDSPE